MRQILLALCFLVVATACGSQDAGTVDVALAPPASLSSLPATLEGELAISVSEGDEGEFNFGDLTTADGAQVPVEVGGDVLVAAGIPLEFESARVRATISSKSQYDSYVISKLEKL